MKYEDRKALTEGQIKEMSRKELESLALGYWVKLLEQQHVLRSIIATGDDNSKYQAQGVLDGTLKVTFDSNV